MRISVGSTLVLAMAALSAMGCNDGVADLEIANPDEVTTCAGSPQEMCDRACTVLPPDEERIGAACELAKANTPGTEGDTMGCGKTFRVNGEDGCCLLATDNVHRFYRCE
jgi:hypothetical protein